MKTIKNKSLSIALVMILLVLSLFLTNNGLSEVKASSKKNPVIFVHGLGGASYNFLSIKSNMIQHGWSEDMLYAVDLPIKILSMTNNSVNSQYLSNFIDQVLESTGSDKVDIIAHSMGGSNSLYYAQYRNGSSKIDQLITLGGANRLAVTSAPAGIEVTSIYSNIDTIVANSLSYLRGANNIEISGVGHIGLLTSIQVNNIIVETLD